MAKKNKYIIEKELIDKLRAIEYQKEANEEAILSITKFLGELKAQSQELWYEIYKSVGLDPLKEEGKGNWTVNWVTREMKRFEKKDSK